MFKRLAKKRDRDEEDEASGMKEIKAILNMGGEDEISGESDSDSDDEDDDSSDEEEEGEDGEEGEEGSDDGESMDDEEEEEEDGEAAVFDTPIPIPLNKIASSPLYPDPSNPAFQACILCPDKVLKNQQMTDAHMTAKSHKRALARFVAHLQKGDPGSEDGRVIVDEINTLLEKENRKLERMKEMYAAEVKGKSLENRTNAKAKRLAKKALRDAAAAADPNSTAAATSTSKPKPKQKNSEEASKPGEPSKTQQKKAARREESIQKKRTAREAARIANGGKDEGSVVGSEVSDLVPSKPIKRSKLAAANAELSSSANRRGGGGARAKAAKKSKGGGMTEEEAAKRTAEGRAKKAAATKPADGGWGARKGAAGGVGGEKKVESGREEKRKDSRRGGKEARAEKA